MLTESRTCMSWPALLMSTVQQVGLNLERNNERIPGPLEAEGLHTGQCVLNGNNASVETDQIDIFMQFGAGQLPFRVLLSFTRPAFRRRFVPLSGCNNRAGSQHLVFGASGRKWQKACLIYLPGFPHVIWLIMWLIKDTENPLTPGLYNDGSFIFHTMECLSHSTPCQRRFPLLCLMLQRVACPPLPSFTQAYVPAPSCCSWTRGRALPFCFVLWEANELISGSVTCEFKQSLHVCIH